MDAKHLLILALQASIVAMVFSFGLGLKPGDLSFLLRRPGLFLRSVLAVLVVMPALAVVLVRALDLRQTTEVALIALAISPMPPLLPMRDDQAGGRRAYAMALMVTLAALAIAAIPLTVRLLALYTGRPLGMAPGVIARIVLITVVLPVAAGVATQAFAAGVADRLARGVSRAATGLLVLASLGFLAGVWRAVWAAVGDGTVLAMVLFVLAGLLIGHRMGGPVPDESPVLALATACRHPAVALSIASANFPGDRFDGTILLYMIVGLIVGLPYLAWCRRRNGRKPLQRAA